MSQGLSHIVLHASTPEDFERTLVFYTTFGFEKILDQEDHINERRVWLKLKGDAHALTTDVTIKVSLSISAMRRAEPPADLDWSLEETSIVLTAPDIEASVKHSLKRYYFWGSTAACTESQSATEFDRCSVPGETSIVGFPRGSSNQGLRARPSTKHYCLL